MNTDDAVFADLANRLRSPLDPVLSDPTRLRILAALRALPTDGAMSFTTLGKVLQLTDGNLGLHLRLLTDAAFVEKQEHWRGKRRTTMYQVNAVGNAAFQGHVKALEAIIGSLDPAPKAHPSAAPPGVQSAAVAVPSNAAASHHVDEGIGQAQQDPDDGVPDARNMQ